MFEVIDVRCEYAKNPIGIGKRFPRFSWKIISDKKGVFQRSYRIIAATQKELLENTNFHFSDIEISTFSEHYLWDSGTIDSDQNVAVFYKGKPLKSGLRVYYRIEVADHYGQIATSKVAFFETAFLDNEWQAKWICAGEDTEISPIFRKNIMIKKNVKKANAYICGVGYFEAFLNGNKISDELFIPNTSDYHTRNLQSLLYPYDDDSEKFIYYKVFDITEFLECGKNVLNIWLGNGFYNQRNRQVEGKLWYDVPKLISELHIFYQDDTKDILLSDETFKVTPSPIIFNNLFYGEIYDATKELNGLFSSDFDESILANAVLARIPDSRLISQESPSDGVIRELTPKNIIKKDDGMIIDFGENISGFVEIKGSGQRASKVVLRFAEILDSENNLDFSTSIAGPTEQIQSNTYIFKGEGVETYSPRFVWYGFRYVQIIPMDCEIYDIKAKFVCSKVDVTGRFESSNALFTTLNKNFIRGQLGNMHGGIPSDCPHRERLGYTADGQNVMESVLYNIDSITFYIKWLLDIIGTQNRKTGFVAHTAPFNGGGGGVGWGSAIVIVPWNLYRFTGDLSFLSENYIYMKKWIDYLKSRIDERGIIATECDNHQLDCYGLGDWCSPEPNNLDKAFVNQYFYVMILQIMEEVARLIGKEENFNAKEAIDAWNNVYYNEETGNYLNGEFGANGFAIERSVAPAKAIEAFKKHLLENNYHFTMGIFGCKAALYALSETDNGDIAYRLMNQRDYPSFGYMVECGATTIWETFKPHASLNHPMFGFYSGWFYKKVAGIEMLEAGFKSFKIEPMYMDTYTFAQVETMMGTIVVEIKNEESFIEYNIDVPGNSTCELVIPNSGVNGVNFKNGKYFLILTSGQHKIEIKK